MTYITIIDNIFMGFWLILCLLFIIWVVIIVPYKTLGNNNEEIKKLERGKLNET